MYGHAALLLLAAAAAADMPWSGPEVKVAHRNGWPLLTIQGQLVPAQWFVAHSLGDAGNKSSPPTTAFDVQIAGAATAGIRLVEMPITGGCCLETQVMGGQQVTGWLSDAHPLNLVMRAALDRAIELHPTILFFFRLYVQQPDPAPGPPGPIDPGGSPGHWKPGVLGWGDLDDVGLVSGNGSHRLTCNSGNTWCSRMNSVTKRWTQAGRLRIQTLLRYLDRQYPGRVAGVRTTMLRTGEWDLPQPPPFDGWPTLYGDYSEAQKNEFCQGSRDPDCRLPLPDARQSVTMAQADGEAQRMNLFMQEQLAQGTFSCSHS